MCGTTLMYPYDYDIDLRACKCGPCPMHSYTTTTTNAPNWTFTTNTPYQPKHRKPGPAQ